MVLSAADVKMEIPDGDTITEIKHLELNQFSDRKTLSLEW